jgi:hypothetical protein
MGGHLFLPPVSIVDLDPALMERDGYLDSKLTDGMWVIVDRRSLSTQVRDVLTRARYHEADSDSASRYVLWRR